eukprot:CAMPEP_0197825920 /NCGR_PEP_ID=MMETSP1437-20131217/2948_1 /TAXON_ID=49252 ORGANISM="Eucampia antarctica, Strain CCMP1452" /NCGR_SAMPLE_ID=MMETSP1437 /ASSEMBLY_ACC=CAM_ASM_001096 /LENGTH=310 /DNA_ID=CAMNT_0043426137 /DNA_START=41 /DNA_END=974 /DNA_ORIENTATION=+
MAKHLARIHGTEEDKVNCPFYFKIGACRHADRCSRLHHRPAFSPTILIKHIYCHPVREAELLAVSEGRDRSEITVDKEKATEDFLQFFENMYEELGKFGRLDALHVCDNLGDHMVGHVYAKFGDEEEASDALNVMNGRFYDGRKMDVEFSPVTDFREARCRDFDEETCSRGGFCNFMHIKPIPMCLIRNLEEDTEDDDEEKRPNSKLSVIKAVNEVDEIEIMKEVVEERKPAAVVNAIAEKKKHQTITLPTVVMILPEAVVVVQTPTNAIEIVVDDPIHVPAAVVTVVKEERKIKKETKSSQRRETKGDQ